MNNTIILILAIIFIVGYVISIYNWFQTAKTRIVASIQDIGNQLKRQSALIPNLESSVKAYLKHEKGIFEDLTKARTSIDKAVKSGDLAKIESASDNVNDLVSKFQVIVESNPEIKGEKVVTKLMDELRDTSDKLMYSRRVVIDLSADFNQRLVTFPSNIIASIFKFENQKGLETPMSGSHLTVSEDEVSDPKITL